jgi:hypothetical protein
LGGSAIAAAGRELGALFGVLLCDPRLLVLHGWRSMDHLDGYLTGSAVATAASLAAHGATLDQFAGQIAAEYSWLET